MSARQFLLLCAAQFACLSLVHATAETHRIALVQFDSVPEQNARNVEAIARLATTAAGRGAKFIMFHEVTVTDYVGDVEKFSEEVPGGPACQSIGALAKSLGVYISFGLSEKTDDKRYYITQVFMGPQGFVYKYRKTWINRGPSVGDGVVGDNGYRNEHARYDCGTGPEIFSIGGLRATCFICADAGAQRCIDRARLLGPDIVFFPNNRASYLGRRGSFLKIAAEIGAPMLVANRVGKSWMHDCRGGCAFISGSGEVLANTLPGAQEEILIFDLPVEKRAESAAQAKRP